MSSSQNKPPVPRPQIFDGLTAWFSESVTAVRIQMWSRHGGKLASANKADFIFSEDQTVADTQKLFDSEAYLDDCLAIFHPMYIDCCVQAGNMDSVTLGGFFLPSADVYAAIKHNYQYRWEIIERRTPKSSQKQIFRSGQRPGSRNARSQTAESRPISQSPQSSPVQSARATDNANTTNAGNSARRNLNGFEDPNVAAGTEEDTEVPIGIMADYSGYTKVESIPKVGHELFDFVPGTNNCVVTRASVR